MSGRFGGIFDEECGEDSTAAARLGARFGGTQQDLYDYERSHHNMGQPAPFDMAELLAQFTNEIPQPPLPPTPVQPSRDTRDTATSDRTLLMAEAAAFPAEMPRALSTPASFLPLGDAIDFHYANVVLPPFPVDSENYYLLQQQQQTDEWDNRLMSLSWQEALASNETADAAAVSDLDEIPYDEVISEINNQDSASAEFWTSRVRLDEALRRPVQEYEYEFPVNEEEMTDDSQWALEEGLKALAAGDVPTAVYLLETAVRIDPENSEAWYQLGTAQQLNENDKAAIAALQKCLSLNSKHPVARIALSASFTNELRRADALMALSEWSDLHLPDGDENARNRRQRWEAMGDFSSYTFQHQLFTETEARLQRILELNPSAELSANVESALGILYNISEDYEKAAQHFERAIVRRPEDAVLYNRLGASLANGDRNGDAVAAYRRALELSPGLLRTRYNLGIASCNMHAYNEAVHHFLSVLNKQNETRSAFRPIPPPVNPRGGLNRQGASASVWASLRMAFLAMDRRDLYDLALEQNLPQLNQSLGSIVDDPSSTE